MRRIRASAWGGAIAAFAVACASGEDIEVGPTGEIDRSPQGEEIAEGDGTSPDDVIGDSTGADPSDTPDPSEDGTASPGIAPPPGDEPAMDPPTDPATDSPTNPPADPPTTPPDTTPGTGTGTTPSTGASVCDTATVTGTGAPGMMDNLEREAAQLQAFPNPAQGDGRDGSWSWYPQTATVEILADGGSNVVRYAGNGLAAWSGVTIAFLGSNGGGACYDASAYQGVRFRIRGSVAATDVLDGTVVLSFVTAETQSDAFGGDLAGEGGHFNYQIGVTSAWQTVEVRFDELAAPTWGATASLASVAVDKLQALDFGVSNAASSFEIFLDDIELF